MLLQWPTVYGNGLHGFPGFAIATQADFIAERRIKKVFVVIRIIAFDKSV